ncbi:MAG: hypothetical protein K9L30_02280 [Desulfobacterales bacterium]|nr:hypothetical protein [Desulfobacterales bacterium]
MNKMKKKQRNKIEKELKYHLAGWILFILCALFFLASSLKNHDTMALIGSIIFFVACIIFLIPLVKSLKSNE